jgi:hypothetical protein
LGQDPAIGDHLEQIYEKEGLSYSSRGMKRSPMGVVKVKVSPKPAHHVSAEFFILLAPGPRVTAVKFLHADEIFPGATEALKSARFDVSFPDENPVQILRRGIIDCEPEIPDCTVAFITPSDVHSMN